MLSPLATVVAAVGIILGRVISWKYVTMLIYLFKHGLVLDIVVGRRNKTNQINNLKKTKQNKNPVEW